jgi:hypothetical protein
MLTSETLSKIMPAFIKAQASFKPAVKDAVNPAFSRGGNAKPSYVTLAQAIDAVEGALRANGIALVQQTDVTDNGTILITRLFHESGEWIAGRYPVHPVKSDPQGEGSALTYARRYALMALVGIAPEDDDGNAAVKAVEGAEVTSINQAWIDAAQSIVDMDGYTKLRTEAVAKFGGDRNVPREVALALGAAKNRITQAA